MYNSFIINQLPVFISFYLFRFITAVDLCYGNILCFQCGDYVYDRELLKVAKAQWSELAKSLSFGEFYRAWEPTQTEAELLRNHPRRRRVVENSTIGIEKNSQA